MHAARERRLLQAVEALVQGRRLTLTDLARSWPGATWVHAPLKALDRLLSNQHLQHAVSALHQAMAAWLIRQPQPVLLVDWADLKEDGRWCVLRAAVPMGGRALTLYERIYPRARMGQPQAQQEFVRALWQFLPRTVKPILVTDAGFRSDWYRAVRAVDWHFIGRLRNNTSVCSAKRPHWQPCRDLHALATAKPRDLGLHRLVKGNPMHGRLVLARRDRRGREQYTRHGTPQQGAQARKSRKAAREPWLLVTSLERTAYTTPQIVGAYAKRMQIEEAFRDLKSHQYGMGLEDSLTRSAPRLSILLLLHALATFAAWLMGMAADTELAAPDPLARQPLHRARYSRIRRGLAWLRQSVVPPEIARRLNAASFRAIVAGVV